MLSSTSPRREWDELSEEWPHDEEKSFKESYENKFNPMDFTTKNAQPLDDFEADQNISFSTESFRLDSEPNITFGELSEKPQGAFYSHQGGDPLETAPNPISDSINDPFDKQKTAEKCQENEDIYGTVHRRSLGSNSTPRSSVMSPWKNRPMKDMFTSGPSTQLERLFKPLSPHENLTREASKSSVVTSMQGSRIPTRKKSTDSKKHSPDRVLNDPSVAESVSFDVSLIYEPGREEGESNTQKHEILDSAKVDNPVVIEYIPNQNGAKRLKVDCEAMDPVAETHPNMLAPLTSHQDYPDDIDFLDDLHDKNPSHDGTSGILDKGKCFYCILILDAQPTALAKKKLITIRNLNSSSAFLSRLGEHHNMMFNNETKKWEGDGEDLYISLQEDEATDKKETKAKATAKTDLTEDDSLYLSSPDNKRVDQKKEETTTASSAQPLDDSLALVKSFNLSALNALDARFQSLADIDMSVLPTVQDSKPDPLDSLCERKNGTQSENNTIRPSLSAQSVVRLGSVGSQHAGINSNDQLLKRLILALKIDQEWKMTDELDFSGQNLTSALDMKEYLPNLRHLNLDSNRLTHLQGLPENIRKLSVTCNRLSNLTSFQSLRNLHILDVSRNNISDVSAFLCLSHLRELHISHNNITDISLLVQGSDGDGLECLRLLNASGNTIQDISFDGNRLPYLVSLDVSFNHIRSVKGLDTMPSLQELNLENNQMTVLRAGNGQSNLQMINISENRLTNFDGKNFSCLQRLFADGNDLKSFSNEHDLWRLEILSLRQQRGTLFHSHTERVDFNKMIALKQLNISGNVMISPPNLRNCTNLTQLAMNKCGLLSLCGNDNKPSFAVHNLKVLNVCKNKLTDIHCLNEAVHLKRLDLKENELVNFSSLIRVLRQFKQIEILDIRYNPISSRFYHDEVISDVEARRQSMAIKDIASSTSSFIHSAWASQDQTFKKMLTDSEYVRRLCYRSSIIHSLKHTIKVLDGLVVSEKDRKMSTIHIDKLKKTMKSKSISCSRNSNKHPSSTHHVTETNAPLPESSHPHESTSSDSTPIDLFKSLNLSGEMKKQTSLKDSQNPGDTSAAQDLSLFENWKPVSRPLVDKNARSNLYLNVDRKS